MLRRRLSSSTARRFCSSILKARARRSPGGMVLYLLLPICPLGGLMELDMSEGVRSPPPPPGPEGPPGPERDG